MSYLMIPVQGREDELFDDTCLGEGEDELFDDTYSGKGR